MKRLVLCFDGTWNAVATPDANTNVVRLANLVTTSNSKGVPQICYYNSGVGSGGPIDRFIGGAFGAGLKNNVKRGLAFLALNYDKGDEIYLFGFSRGGYTARALAGVLGTAGIPLDIAETERHWTLYQEVAKLRDKAGRYPKGSPRRLPYDAKIEAKKKSSPMPPALGARSCRSGAWASGIRSGAYGIPGGFGLSAISRLLTLWTRGFRDTKFGKGVKLGLHAIAVDEMRRPFVPTFWTLREKSQLVEGQEVEQVWFPGRALQCRRRLQAQGSVGPGVGMDDLARGREDRSRVQPAGGDGPHLAVLGVHALSDDQGSPARPRQVGIAGCLPARRLGAAQDLAALRRALRATC